MMGRETATLTYWTTAWAARNSTDAVVRNHCISVLCTLGTACSYERIRVAAARNAMSLMPRAQWGVS